MSLKRLMITALLIVAGLFSSYAPVFASILDTWVWRNPLPQVNNMRAVSYGNGQFVAVGDSGAMAASQDGTSWAVRISGVTTNLNGVACGNNGFVAVGNGGVLLSSADGVTWTPRTSGTTSDLRAVAYGNSLYVAVGYNGTVVTSPDGSTWTAITGAPNDTDALTGIAFGPAGFVAVGTRSGGGTIWSSADGTTGWAGQTRAEYLSAVAYGNGLYVAAGQAGDYSGNGAVVTSSDGTAWSTQYASAGSRLFAVSYGPSGFVAVGYGGVVTSSSSGTSWASGTSGTTANLNAVAGGGGGYAAVGDTGVTLTSTNAVSWSTKSSGGGQGTSLNSVAYGGNGYVAVGTSGSVFTSADGVAWSAKTVGSTEHRVVRYLGGYYFVGDYDGSAWVSADGQTFNHYTNTPTYNVFTASLNGAAYSSTGTLVAVSANGDIVSTTDLGATWNKTSLSTERLYDVAYGNGTFVAVGLWGHVLSSPDGASWTPRVSNTTSYLASVAFGGGKFVAVGNGGGIATSTDGVVWSAQQFPAGSTDSYQAVTYGSDGFVAVSSSGTMVKSADGVTWSTIASSGFVASLNGVAFDGTQYVGVGFLNAILQTGVQVEVVKTGDGTGTVTSSTGGLVCGSACSETHVSGTSVILNATAANGSAFVGWSGCSTSTASAITVPVDSYVTCFANFKDTTPLTVNSTTPSSGAAGIVPDPAVKVVFSRAVDPATVTSSSFTVTGPSGAVPGSVSYDATTNTVTFTPTGYLDFSATYTATVTTAVKTASGTALSSNQSWNFTIVANYFNAAVDPYNGSAQIDLNWYGFPGQSKTLNSSNPYKLIKAVGATPPADCSGVALYQGYYTDFYDSSLTPSTQYSYRLCAYDTEGKLLNSTTATVATLGIYTLTTATAATGGATGTVYPDTGTQTAGSTVYLEAYPGTNSVFDHWSGDCSGTSSYTTLVMNSDKSCTANFAPIPAPAVTSTSPISGAAIVDPVSAFSNVIYLNFNVPLKSSTIDATTVIVQDGNGTPVAGTAAYDTYYNNRISFTPSAVFAGGTTYTVKATTGIQNANGVPLAADYTFSFTVTPHLGGIPAEGNLLVIPENDGKITVYRYISGSWQNQVYGNDHKGSRLQVGTTGTSFGWFSNGSSPTLVTNTQSSVAQTRTEWTTTTGLRVVQILTYQPGAVYYGLNWQIANESTTDATSLHFFHGEDTYFLGSDRGAGFWDAPNNTIGVQRTYGTELRRMSLQAVTAPFAYDSENYGTVYDNVNNGALTNTIDASESTDNGYGMEWRTDTLAAGSSWSISAFEKFADVPVGAVYVTAPVSTSCTAGTPCNLIYTVTNTTTSAANVNLTLTPDQTGWNATTSPTSITVAAGGSVQVPVQLTVPLTAADGLIGHLRLDANDGTATASDTGAVHVLNVTATYALSTATGGTGSGTVDANPAQGPYAAGSSVSLIATPSTGSTFTGWSGDCSGTTNPYVLVMNAAKSCTANFAQVPATYTVATATGGNGAGTVLANPAQGPYSAGTTVSLTATASVGSTFLGWSGDCSGTMNPYPLQVNGNKSCTANFGVNGACGSANDTTVTAAPVDLLCSVGTASAVSGAGPWSWSCAVPSGGTVAACSANIVQYDIAIPSLTDGTVDGPLKVSHGFDQDYVIEPVAGYQVSGVQLDGAPIDTGTSQTGYYLQYKEAPDQNHTKVRAVCTLKNVTANHSVTATFTPIVYEITDAQQAFNLVSMDLANLTEEQKKKFDLAPVIDGVPQPDGDVKLGDVVVILNHMLGLLPW